MTGASSSLLLRAVVSRCGRHRSAVTVANRLLLHSVSTPTAACVPSATTIRAFSAMPASEQPILGVGKYKTSTGLVRKRTQVYSLSPSVLKSLTTLVLCTEQVGLAVEPDWYNVMLKKFQALLDKLEASDMPETAQYRIDVTKWCNYVIASVKANPDSPEAVEDAVQMGQVEELIEMADDEMICMDVYLETRMWELVEASNPYIDFNPDPMRDPFGEDGNAAEQEALRKGMEQQKQK
jgi:ETC complex I subunit conserved region